MRSVSIAVLAAAGIALTGCATSTASYSPPSVPKIENSKVVNKPFEVVWDGLVKNLSSDFFVINNIDKNSRLINLSFTSQTPSEYVDCGVTTRVFNNVRGEQRVVYKTADGAFFNEANDIGHVFAVRRATRLEGRSNIYVAPEGDGTNVTVNTKYVVNINVSVTAPDGRPAGGDNHIVDLSTKQPYDNGSLKCAATGNIESRILDAVK